MARKKKDEYEEEYEGDGQGFIFPDFNLSKGAKRTIFACFLVLLAILFTLGLFGAAGPAGAALTGVVGKVFGFGKYIMPGILLFIAFILVRTQMSSRRTVTKITGAIIMFLCILSLIHIIMYDQERFAIVASEGRGGGYIGYLLAQFAVSQLDKLAAGAVFLFLGLIAGIFALNKSLVGIGDKVKTPEVDLGSVKDAVTVPSLGGFFGKKKTVQRAQTDDYEDISEERDDFLAEEYDLDPAEFDDFDAPENPASGKEQAQVDESEEVFEEDDGYEYEYEDEAIEEVQPVSAAQKAEQILGAKQETQRSGQKERAEDFVWELPPLRLLERGGKKAKGGNTKERAQVIQDTFADFGIDMVLEDIVTGPTVTQFSFRPPSGVKLTKIKTLSDDLALALAAHPIRIEAPIPGKSLVGIEVPNKEKAMVRMRNLINTDEFEDDSKPLLLALGEDVNGEHVVEDLAKMPHLLVAGATGAGKSVTVNSILLSLLYKNSPDDLKMILVDPKRVELSLYNGIPHLLSEVITDNGKVINALKWAVSEMERRYKVLQKVGTRDLKTYKKMCDDGETVQDINPETDQVEAMPLENLPVIVVVIDEMADLMASHGKEVEGVIVRLAQMSRAVGIHLIVSTQRPSVEVITGTIKANLPTRIALRVATGIDSRTIIDTPGAEKLVGHGDMLYVGTNSASPKRLQGVFVEEEEVKKVIDFIKRQAKATGAYDVEENFGSDESDAGAEAAAARGITSVDFDTAAKTATEIGGGGEDPMYEQAKEIVIEADKASTSYIQRRLRVGYSRAARLIDELEDNGVIGPADGSKPRKVLVAAESEEEEYEYEDDDGEEYEYEDEDTQKG